MKVTRQTTHNGMTARSEIPVDDDPHGFIASLVTRGRLESVLGSSAKVQRRGGRKRRRPAEVTDLHQPSHRHREGVFVVGW